jgi:predicted Zn-dependent peptidase
MGVLLQLGRAVRPQSLGELVDRLQEIEAEQLWAFMAQHYQPVKQLQAVGGDEAVVRAQASKLLDRILAGGAAH